MQVVHSLEEAQVDRPGVVTLGVFDGVHLGHQMLIRQLVHDAHSRGLAAIVVSFFPHPDLMLNNVEGRYYLTHPMEKARLLDLMGVDLLVLHPFNEEVRQMRALTFVERLHQFLKMESFWATPNFAMGHDREGTIPFLTTQGQDRGFSVHTVDLLSNNTTQHQIISSSDIRSMLNTGDLTGANDALGRPYRVFGEVIHGDQRGRTIGFPTANLAVWEEQIIPAHGVYACRALLNGEDLFAVTNIGLRPTFGGQNVTVEAHLLDFDNDIYGQTLTLDFMERLRGEQKFSGLDALKEQIGKDRDRAREIFGV